jgi:photosystem II stability/assembly factor-like uncharacterized protein
VNHSTLTHKLIRGVHLFVIAALLGGVALGLSSAPVARAAAVTIEVDTTTDSNAPAFQACTAAAPSDCSLRGAISKANGDIGNDYTIVLPAGTYVLTGAAAEDLNASGDLDIRYHLTINGAGRDTTIIDGDEKDRVVHIMNGVRVVINSVTIRRGRTPDGQAGADANPSAGGPGGPGGSGGDGGGIHNSGQLTLDSSRVISNTTGAGGGGGTGRGSRGGGGGAGGDGGGIYNAGYLALNGSAVVSNTTGFGGDGGGAESASGGHGGRGGHGGGIYNTGGIVELAESLVNGNRTGGGGDGGSGWNGGDGGRGGHGGGICNAGSSVELVKSTVRENATGNGGAGDEDGGAGGGGGRGGGIYSAGALLLTSSTVSSNRTGDGAIGQDCLGCESGFGGHGGDGGDGGGICNSGGTVRLTNSTVSGNTTGDGKDGGDGGGAPGGNGGDGGDGGGIYTSGDMVELTHVTVSGNSAAGIGGTRGGGSEPSNTDGTPGSGGGIRHAGSVSPTLRSTILAGNSAAGRGPDCDCSSRRWVAVNTGLTNTNVLALGLSPGFATDSTLFAGTDGGGVFKSMDGGANWTQVISGLTDLDVEALGLSPGFATDNTLFAGTFLGAVSGGVFKSADGGANWTQVISGLTNLDVRALGLSPSFATDNTLFAGTFGGGVFKSTDGGANWTGVIAGLTDLDIVALGLSPGFATDSTLFAGTRGGGLFKSTDGGANWSDADAGITDPDVMALGLSPSFATDNTLFAGTLGGGVFKSTDRGANWSAANSGITNPDILALAVSPDFASDDTVLTGSYDGGVFDSTDGGANWTAANAGLTDDDIFALAFSPSFVDDRTGFAGTFGGGVFRLSGGALVSQNYNLLGDNSDCTFVADTEDQVGTGASPIDPQLGALALNAPGSTETHALLDSSPALDHIPDGVNGCGSDITDDQRGVARPQAAGCDIGAFERAEPGTIVVEKQTVPDGTPSFFDFTDDIESPFSFSLSDGRKKAFTAWPRTYTVTEADSGPDFDLTAISCSDIDSAGDAATGVATVSLQSGETVTCVFTNALRLGTIVIEKETGCGGETGPLVFEVPNVLPGTYAVTEGDPAPAFELMDITCDDVGSTTPSTGDAGTRTATFNLDPGESVACRFTNAYLLSRSVGGATLPVSRPEQRAIQSFGRVLRLALGAAQELLGAGPALWLGLVALATLVALGIALIKRRGA